MSVYSGGGGGRGLKIGPDNLALDLYYSNSPQSQSSTDPIKPVVFNRDVTFFLGT